MNRSATLTAVLAAASITLATAGTALADTPSPEWDSTDHTIVGLEGERVTELCVYAPGDTSRCGDALRARIAAAKAAAAKAAKAKAKAKSAKTAKTPRVAGQASRPWRPTTTCRPLTRTTAGHLAWPIRTGDTLWLVSQCTRHTVGQLRAANPGSAVTLRPGRTVVIP
jgi:hypothetical protein